MSYVPSVDEARDILKKFNQDEFHLKHGEIVSGVMGYFAREYDPEQEEFWKVVGMLHDLEDGVIIVTAHGMQLLVLINHHTQQERACR